MNLIEALEAASIDYHKGRDSSEIYICCPWCNDQRFRLGVNVETGYAHCFNDSCEWSSKNADYTFSKLQDALDTGEIEAKQRKRKKKKRMEQIELPEGFRELQHPSENDYHWNKVAWRYLRDRGISGDQIVEKKIGFTTVDKDYSYRAIFPVWLSGKLVGFTGRDFTGKLEPKYKNSIGAKCLYNLPEKKHSTCVLSESAIPALVIERVSRKMGIDSIGLLGHSLQEDQVSLLHHYKRVLLWLDPDGAGVKGLEHIHKRLRDEKKSVKVILPKGMLSDDDFDSRDPDELDHKEIVNRLEKPIPFTDSLLLKLQAWRSSDE
jgi:DNA primase